MKESGDKANKPTCESKPQDQRISGRELKENCIQSIATVLNGSQDLSEVFNFSTKEKKK